MISRPSVVVEEYHPAPKTGGAIEPMQFESAAWLEPAIALVSVGALVLLPLRAATRRWRSGRRGRGCRRWGRGAGGLALRGADAGVDGGGVHARAGPLGGAPTPTSDGSPGWQTLGQGWTQRQALVQGVRLLQSYISGGT